MVLGLSNFIWVAGLALALSMNSSSWAATPSRSGIFSNSNCMKFLQSMRIDTNYKDDLDSLADRSGVPPGPHRHEFYERVRRIDWLAAEHHRLTDLRNSTRELALAYSKELNSIDETRKEIWDRVRFAVAAKSLELHPDDINEDDFKNLFPRSTGIDTVAPSYDKVLAISNVLDALTDLANYQLKLSEEFKRLPLKTTVAEADRKTIAEAIERGHRQWSRITTADKRDSFKLDKEGQQNVLLEARYWLESPDIPKEAKEQIRRHLNFVRKYKPLKLDTPLVNLLTSLQALHHAQVTDVH